MKCVIVMFDSLNRHMLPPYGCDWTHAPNFARLARTSTWFRNTDGPATEIYIEEFFAANKDTPKNTIQHLSDIDRELIIRWILRDYRPVYGGATIK